MLADSFAVITSVRRKRVYTITIATSVMIVLVHMSTLTTMVEIPSRLSLLVMLTTTCMVVPMDALPIDDAILVTMLLSMLLVMVVR